MDVPTVRKLVIGLGFGDEGKGKSGIYWWCRDDTNIKITTNIE